MGLPAQAAVAVLDAIATVIDVENRTDDFERLMVEIESPDHVADLEWESKDTGCEI
jgi:hypothetical protein